MNRKPFVLGVVLGVVAAVLLVITVWLGIAARGARADPPDAAAGTGMRLSTPGRTDAPPSPLPASPGQPL